VHFLFLITQAKFVGTFIATISALPH